MTTQLNGMQSFRNLRAMLAIHRDLQTQESVFCTKDNLEESLSTLSEELDSLDISTVTIESDDSQSLEILTDALVKLINAFWRLINKHRELMKSYERHKDVHNRVANDNVTLKNNVKRLKEDLEKKQIVLCQIQERERRLKVQYENVSKDLKREKDEVLKLRKQAQSKDNQHEHELRRIMQNGHKLREQLQKSIGTYIPKDKILQNIQAEHEKEMHLYEQTIKRLEENNRQMLQEINELKEQHLLSTGIQLPETELWTDT